MVIDKLGRVHVAFESCGLAYGVRDSVWHVIYPSPGWGGKCPSLTLDRGGEPHIVSTMGYGYDALVVYTYREGGEWHVEVVDTVSDPGRATLVLDRDCRPHVVYGYLGRGLYVYRPGFRYAVRVGKDEWEIEEVDTIQQGRIVACNPVLAMDSLGRVWVVYEMVDSTWDRYLKFAVRGRDGEWHVENIESHWGEPWDMAMSVDGDGNVHLIYTLFELGSCGVLKYGWWGGGEWHVEVVDTVYGPLAIVTWDDMVVGGDGKVHIAYSNQMYPAEGRLMYCWGKPEVGVREGGGGSDCEGLLRVEPVVSSGMVEVIMELRSERYIELDLYDVSGRRVRELWSGYLGRGEHRISVDLGELCGGVYFIVWRVEGYSMGSKKVLFQ